MRSMNEMRRMEIAKSVCLAVLLLLVVYMLTAVIVFDFSKPAYPYDEEYHQGRLVAIGPRPRSLFLPPTRDELFYEATEWPFEVYAPVCGVWRTLKGYAPPAELRVAK